MQLYQSVCVSDSLIWTFAAGALNVNDVDAIFEGSFPCPYETLLTTYPLMTSAPCPEGSEFPVFDDAIAYVIVELTAKINVNANTFALNEKMGAIFTS